MNAQARLQFQPIAATECIRLIAKLVMCYALHCVIVHCAALQVAVLFNPPSWL